MAEGRRKQWRGKKAQKRGSLLENGRDRRRKDKGKKEDRGRWKREKTPRKYGMD